MTHTFRAFAAAAAVCGLAACQQPSAAPAVGSREWPLYGGPQGTRYSPLTQINRSNVSRLEVAWTFDSGEAGGLQTQPIMIDGTVYVLTPSKKVVALDAATGAVRWTFDSELTDRSPNRGLTYWSDGEQGRLFTSVSSYVYALDAKSGTPIASFGTDGRIDLREGLGRDADGLSVGLSTPGVVYKDLLIVGSRTAETLPSAPGDIRAYDTRTGALRWTFHTIPHPGEPGYETWPPDAWTRSGAANNWAGLTLDETRGVVYVPTGSAAFDFYGGDRLGDNLYANSIIALRAETGERIWHYQAVHHDIWDRDFSAPPTLITVERDGRSVDGLVQPTKTGVLFTLDRDTGEPLFPTPETPVPPSDVPGEVASPTQPIPSLPAPVVPQTTTEEMLTTRTPEAHQFALERLREMRTGSFVPMAVGRNTLVSPGWNGGVEWGGMAFDPESRLLFVNASNIPEYTSLAEANAAPPVDGRELYRTHCASCHKEDMSGTPPQVPSLVGVGTRRSLEEIGAVIRQGAGQMPGFAAIGPPARNAILQYILTGRSVGATSAAVPRSPYRFTGYNRFVDQDGYPAVATPWGTLNAIDMNTGEYRWKIPFGEYPELVEQGIRNTGTENYGGPIVTAGGLVFIGATLHDRKFHAYDASTGALLWETTLPFAGTATPITYEADGRQFVLIAAGGRRVRPTGGTYVAFALKP